LSLSGFHPRDAIVQKGRSEAEKSWTQLQQLVEEAEKKKLTFFCAL
jgi:hypothetical protein